jgi:hypothetical protein
MGVPISNLKDLKKIQMQLNNEKKNLISKFEIILTNLSLNRNPFAQNNP